MSKDKGLLIKYEVTKVSEPNKQINCIVLEFEDPIARVGIKSWAEEMGKNGYIRLEEEVLGVIGEFNEDKSD